MADGQKKLSDHSRCPVWENIRLLRAKSRKKAYKEAMKFCQAGHPSKTNGGEWRSAGISMLLPVYDEIEDGAEILWTDHGLMTVRKIQMLIKTKDQLPVFDDTKAMGDQDATTDDGLTENDASGTGQVQPADGKLDAGGEEVGGLGYDQADVRKDLRRQL